MAAGEGGGGNFADSGGYGGNFNASGGGLYNGSASAGGNPTMSSGGVGNFGAQQAAASRVGMPASSMNAAANQAMANYGYVKNAAGVWKDPNAGAGTLFKKDPITGKLIPYTPPKKVPIPTEMPVVKVVKNPITGVLTPTPQKPPGWTNKQWANWQTHYYNSQVGVMQQPQMYTPGKGFVDRIPAQPNYSGGSATGPGGIFGGAPTPGQPGNSLGNPIMGHNDAPTGLGGDWGSPDYGNPSGSGGVGGAITGDYRGLALGGISGPGEKVIVGEHGPEMMQAPAGATVMPFKVGSQNLGLMHDKWRQRAIIDAARGGQQPAPIGNGRMGEVQQILRGLRQQRRKAA